MTVSQTYSHDDYTIGWVCALDTEQTAATAMLDAEHDVLPNPKRDPNTYTFGSIGGHNIVIACLPEGIPGTNSAAVAATWLQSSFPSLRFGLMVGIGGGNPKNDVRLGDVVVSRPGNGFPGVVQWDFGKAEQRGEFNHTGSLSTPPIELLTALLKLKAKIRLKGCQIPTHLAAMREKWPNLSTKFTGSDNLRDILFRDDYLHIEEPPFMENSSMEIDSFSGEKEEVEEEDEEEETGNCQFCDITKARNRNPKAISFRSIHYGLIASGNMVIKDAGVRNRLNDMFKKKILCVEMEAAGLMVDFPCLVIRGICDYADSHKNKAWQEYAASVAAAFAKELLLLIPVTDVKKMDTISSILFSMRGDIKMAVDYLEEAKVHRRSRHDEKILKWLSRLNYGAEHSDALSQWQDGTNQWFLQSTELNDFIEKSEPFLICSGIPGAGKTVMAAIVIEYLHKRFGDDLKIGIAHIYFNFKQHGEQTPKAIFLSLLKQLAQQQTDLPASVRSLYETYMERDKLPSLEGTISAIEEVIKLYSKVFITIDALDECATKKGSRETIISAIIALSKRSMKFFITSRQIHEILVRFPSASHLEIRATESDIRKYIDSRLSKLEPTSVISRKENMHEEIRARITDAVQGMFLLAQLHFDKLTEYTTPKEIRDALNDLPHGSDAYDRAYSNIVKRINNKRQQSIHQRNLAMKALSWIIYAKRPLLTVELQHALGVELGTDKLDEDNIPQIDHIVSSAFGLLTLDKESNIIRLVHYTAQEYFERNPIESLPDAINAETYIAEICSTYLSYSVFGTGYCDDDFNASKRKESYKFYEYAATYWDEHVKESDFSQIHVEFLKKTPNVEPYIQAIEFMDAEFRRQTGLHIAAGFGLDEIVEALLKDTTHADPRDYHLQTPFFMAACGGHCKVMKLLFDLGRIDINHPSYDEIDISEVDVNEIEVNARSLISGYTPLICAAQGNHVDAIELLLSMKRIEVDTSCDQERDALWYAAVCGHTEVVQLLLEAQKKAQECDKKTLRQSRSSALIGAVIIGHTEVVAQLLKAEHVNVNIKTKKSGPFAWRYDYEGFEGTSDFYWMDPNNDDTVHENISEYVEEQEFRYLNNAMSPLHLAVELGREDIVKLLLSKEEIDVNLKSGDGQTALSRAKEEPDIYQLLLSRGAREATPSESSLSEDDVDMEYE